MIELNVYKDLISESGKMTLHVEEEIDNGSFVTLYGKSGAGKTSLLRIIAGLMEPDKGRIVVNGQAWFDHANKIDLSPQIRQAGFLFQDYALFPNMTVAENLHFAMAKDRDRSRLEELTEIMDLSDLQNRKPETLSGGQKQRVALARTLVKKPGILLLDEPLAALDVEMRSRLQPYILKLHRDYGLTTVMVSHDTSEILKMSDRMLVIDNGQIINQGKPSDIFSHKEISGKFQFVGEIVSMEKQDFIYIISVLIGNELVKVISEESEVRALEIGDKVMVASKAFNPIIKRVN